jgi:tRNA threonylcarbamoyladenosine biosynthesis protein TsaB
MITLAIDAATYVGTVAVLRDRALLAEGEAQMRGATEERLMPAVAALLASAGLATGDVQRIVCGAGPGSFTSLRIAASIAKGLALGTGTELHVVSSLALLVGAAARPAGSYVAAIDALRGEWYAAEFTVGSTGIVAETRPATIVSPDGIADLVASRGATLVGARLSTGVDGAPVALLADDQRPRASGLSRVDPSIVAGPVDLAGWEPAYGRLAEAQVKWEATHGRALDVR